MTEVMKELIRLALDSHKHCVHESAQLCYTLTLLEIEIRRGYELDDDEIEESKRYMADYVLEGLILKGMIEPVGIDPDTGDFYLSLTPEGEQAYEQAIAEDREE